MSPGGLWRPEGIGYRGLELQGVVDHQCRVLGTVPESFATDGRVVDHWAISSSPIS